MLIHARKKLAREERVLQVVLLLSLLRGDPGNHLLQDVWDNHEDLLPQDLIIGSSMAHARLSGLAGQGEIHHKSMDRLLQEYQQDVLADLNALGRYSHRPASADIHAYLLNAHTSIAEPPSPDTPEHHHQGPDHPPTGPLILPPTPPSDDLTPEDLALIEALWKQDVDLGVPRELYEEDLQDLQDGPGSKEKDKDHGKKPKGETTLEEKHNDDAWNNFNFTIDSETGEHLLSESSVQQPPGSQENNSLEFTPIGLQDQAFSFNDTVDQLNIEFNLDEALKLVGLNCSETGETTGPEHKSDWEKNCPSLGLPEDKSFDFEAKDSYLGSSSEDSEVASINSLNDTLDDMIQATHLHHTHPRALQGRLGSLVRSGEMERWQEVVQYLGLPNPHHSQSPHPPMSHGSSPIHGPALHHPHALYPGHDVTGTSAPPPVPRGVLINNATLPPPMPDPMTHNITYNNSMGASSHLVTSSMNLTNTSDLAGVENHHYKMDTNTSLPSEMMYYQNLSCSSFDSFEMSDRNSSTSRLISSVLAEGLENNTSEMNQTTDGLLSSILNDEALGLMEMAMNDSVGCGLSQLPPPDTTGLDISSDSAVSSLGPDRNEDVCHDFDHQPLHTDNSTGNRSVAQDYSGGASYRYVPEDHRITPVAQKKHQMFGKRYFHDSLQGSGAGGLSGPGGVGDVSGYGGHYPPPPPGVPNTMEGATALDPSEMKYSCTMDFRSGPEVGTAEEHVQHNHTYHMSPDGPSGLVRPTARDKHRNRKNDPERTLSRDEKRARSLNVPINCDDVIGLPMDEFNERISKYDLTEAQLSLIRDIRRRGKNKVAAQNCRKRKLDQIMHLAEEVKCIQTRKTDLLNEYEYLSSERARIKHKFSLLYRHIFQSLRDPDGNPYSPHEYSLQQSADGSILLVPRSSSSSVDANNSKPRTSKDDPKQ